jgi:hypothetical protein
MMRFLSHLSRLVATAAILTSSFGLAQNSTVLPRIKTQIDDTKLTKLSGNVAFGIRSASDLGEADSSTQLTHIRLLLSRSTQQNQALTQYMADLQDKTSPSYHKWLTPEQFGKLYGPADSDIAAIVAWLESRGLKVEPLSPGRTNIAFSGTVSQVEEALHVQIHSFQGRGQQFYSNVGEPSIPAALTSVVSGIARLDTLHPTPHHIATQVGQMNPGTKRLEPVAAHGDSKLGPNLTLGSGTASDPYFLYMVPGDAATIYDTPTTYNANFPLGTYTDGSGVTIGIGGDATILAQTVQDYRLQFLGTNSTAVTITNVDGVTSTSDADEAYIDTELSGGLAPGASIHYYTSTDLFSAIDQAISDNTVDIFSLSFGACELDFSSADNASISSMWQQAAAQGIAVTVSTGDSGAAGCDATADSQGNNIATATEGLAVNGLASTPYNIAVGGTDMDGLLSSFTNYVSLTQSTGATYYRSALKYIPESTWNDSTQADGKISANYPYTGTSANIVGGSGGKSSCSTNTTPANEATQGTCTSGYAKPTWQRGTGVPSDSVRDLPDVSLMAGNGYDPATWLVCTDDTYTSNNVTYTTNCVTQSNGSFSFNAFGGTSTAAPAFAGILALVEQKTGGRLGQAAVELYDLYNGSHASSIFHDTTVGNNSVSCTAGTTNCAKNTAGYYYLSGYDTTTGYDLATGMGSVDVNQLVTYWGTGVGATKPTVTVTPASSSVASSQSLTVAVAVSGSAKAGDGSTATPTGTVTLTSGTYTSSTATLSSAGSYTFTIPAGSLTKGANSLTVSYSGDANFASATGTGSVTVTAPGLSLSSSSLTFASTLVGSSAATQSVTLTNSGTATLTLNSITLGGTDASSFSKSTTCGSSLAPAASCPLTVTFTPKAAGTLTASISIADNTGNTSTISLTGTATAPAPIVTLSASSVTFASTLVGSSAATQTITVKNTGTAGLTISKVALGGTNATSFSETTTCGSALAISASCTISVGFTPVASGTLTGTVTITDNASAVSTITLTGTAATPTPVATFSPTTLAFPGTAVGSTATALQTKLTNSGTAALTLTSVSITGTNSSAFAETNTCGTGLAIGASCTVTTTFTPPSVGSFSASITLAGNVSGSVALTGTGTEPSGAGFTLAAAAVTIAPGGSGTSAITATGTGGYTGASTITLSACTLTSSPSGSVDSPSCSITASTVTLAAGSTTGSGGTVTIGTTAAANAIKAKAIQKAQLEQRNSLRRWTGVGGLAIAGILFFGIPARNRKWRSLLGAFAFLAILGFASGCGSGGKKDPGTTAGSYTFTVTGTDAGGTTATATITVTVS